MNNQNKSKGSSVNWLLVGICVTLLAVCIVLVAAMAISGDEKYDKPFYEVIIDDYLEAVELDRIDEVTAVYNADLLALYLSGELSPDASPSDHDAEISGSDISESDMGEQFTAYNDVQLSNATTAAELVAQNDLYYRGYRGDRVMGYTLNSIYFMSSEYTDTRFRLVKKELFGSMGGEITECVYISITVDFIDAGKIDLLLTAICVDGYWYLAKTSC